MAKYGPKPRNLLERFCEKIMGIKRDDGCWEWIGNKNKRGYGRFRINNPRKVMGAHRLSYKLFRGAVPDDAYVLHTCDNPSCVRPSHLFLGSKAANSLDMALKGRAGRCKLTIEAAFAILWRHRSGETQTKLADEYGVTQHAVSRLVRRKHWPLLSACHD